MGGGGAEGAGGVFVLGFLGIVQIDHGSYPLMVMR